jgi:hypothetical protein
MLDLLFWFSLLYWSLIPSTKTPWVDIASVPVNSKDTVLVVLSCICLLWAVIKNQDNAETRPNNWHCYLPMLTVFLLVYAWFTMVFYSHIILPQGMGDINFMEDQVAVSMKFTLIFAGASFLIAYILIARKSPESVRLFLWRLTIGLAGLGMLYSLAGITGAEIQGVRTNMNATQSDYGILRVVGPLFGASTGYFILVPALAFAVQEFYRSSKTQRLFKLGIVFALILTIIGLTSRAALLILGVFFILMGLSLKNKKQAISSIVLLIIIISAAAGIFFSKASSDRLASFEDSARSGTYLISSQIIGHRDLEYSIVGSGYGSYWPWYLVDLEHDLNTNIPMFQTKFGYILYQPHSVLLILVVELGIFGLLYFLSLWIILGRLLINNFKDATFPIFNCGVVASGFSIFFDLFLFKSPQVNVVWWIFLLGALSLDSSISSSKSQNTSSLTDK